MDKDDAYAYFLHKYDRPEQPLTKATAIVTVYRRDKRRVDPDNFAARLKGYWDGLVAAGLLADDSTDVLQSVEHRFIVDPEKAGREGLVCFEIEEV